MFTLQLDWDRPAKISSQATDHVLRVRIVPSASTAQLPLRMAIALDTSTSMSGEKLERAKAACAAVIEHLRDGDRLSLASFATQVTPLLEHVQGNQATTREAIQQLRASGVTRADLALDWLQRTLPKESGVVRVAVLITDGHPTNPQGRMLEQTDGLIDQAQTLADAGIVLYTVGLGNAANFNTNFLVSLSDRGRGAFLYADTPGTLEPQLREQLNTCQAIAHNEVHLSLKPAENVEIQGFCRYRPEYLPLEEVSPNALALSALSATTPTDVLIQVRIPPLGFSEIMNRRDILNLELTASGTSSVSATAAIQYTNSYRDAQQVHPEVDNDRLGWEINLNSTELTRTNDPRRTGELLSNIQVAALKSGRVGLAQTAGQQLDDLHQSGKLNPHKTTGLLRETRKLGGHES